MGKKVATNGYDYDEIIIHISGHPFGTWDTACGTDVYDERPLPRGAKINCTDCTAIYDYMKRYRKNDFERGER